MNTDFNVSITNIYHIFTLDTEQQVSFFHSMNIDLNISTSNVHCIFTLDIKTQVSVKSPSTSISMHLFSFMQTSKYRSNTSLNFSIFEFSLDYKVLSILIS